MYVCCGIAASGFFACIVWSDRENASCHISVIIMIGLRLRHESRLLLTTTISLDGQQSQALQATTNFVFISPCYRTASLARFCSSSLLTITIAPSAKSPKPYAVLMAISICLEEMSNTVDA